MHLIGWDKSITSPVHRQFHRAESDMLKYLLDDAYPRWAGVFDNRQLRTAIKGIQKVFGAAKLGYAPLPASALIWIVKLLAKGQPPIIADITAAGMPKLTHLDISQILYAGWVYWIGRRRLNENVASTFLLTNQLCNQALLQQCAIDKVIAAGGPK
jgi:hypothetical protein